MSDSEKLQAAAAEFHHAITEALYCKEDVDEYEPLMDKAIESGTALYQMLRQVPWIHHTDKEPERRN